jgi:hypothetical protein
LGLEALDLAVLGSKICSAGRLVGSGDGLGEGRA